MLGGGGRWYCPRRWGCWAGAPASLEQPPSEAGRVCVLNTLITPSAFVGLSLHAQGSCSSHEVGVLSKHRPWVLSSHPTPALTELRAPESGASWPCDF